MFVENFFSCLGQEYLANKNNLYKNLTGATVLKKWHEVEKPISPGV